MIKNIGMVALVALFSACSTGKETVRARPTAVKAIHDFSRASIFHVRRTSLYITEDADGGAELKTERAFGNAFLVDKGVLVTAAHVVHEPKATVTVVEVLTPKGKVVARVALTDVSQDIAILEAQVEGVPLRVRERRENEGYAYLAGVLTVGFRGDVWSERYLHEIIFLNPRRVEVKQPHTPAKPIEFLNTVIPGMSGSPLVAFDGEVVGFVYQMATNAPIGNAVPARIILQNLDYYRKNIAAKDKDKSKKSP